MKAHLSDATAHVALLACLWQLANGMTVTALLALITCGIFHGLAQAYRHPPISQLTPHIEGGRFVG